MQLPSGWQGGRWAERSAAVGSTQPLPAVAASLKHPPHLSSRGTRSKMASSKSSENILGEARLPGSVQGRWFGGLKGRVTWGVAPDCYWARNPATFTTLGGCHPGCLDAQAGINGSCVHSTSTQASTAYLSGST